MFAESGGSGGGSSTPSGGKGSKKKAAGGGPYKDFNMEYAKSGRAACRGCEEKILKVRKFIFID